MNERERILAIVVGALVVCSALFFGWDSISKKFRRRRNEIRTIQASVDHLEMQAERARRAEIRVRGYEDRSLPSEDKVAESLYQESLLQKADSAGIQNKSVTVTPGNYRKNAYKQHSFRLTGQANVKQITKLLASIYAEDNLDRVSRLTLAPIGESNELRLDMTVQALSLPGASRSSLLNTGKSNRLSLDDVEKYANDIARRNFFSSANRPPELAKIDKLKADRGKPFQHTFKATDPEEQGVVFELAGDDEPPAGLSLSESGELTYRSDKNEELEFTIKATDKGLPPLSVTQLVKLSVTDPPVEESKDEEFTYLTGVIKGDRSVALLDHRLSGKRVQLEVGEKFSLGELEGTLDRIGRRDANLSVGGRTVRVRIGKSLKDGVPVEK